MSPPLFQSKSFEILGRCLVSPTVEVNKENGLSNGKYMFAFDHKVWVFTAELLSANLTTRFFQRERIFPNKSSFALISTLSSPKLSQCFGKRCSVQSRLNFLDKAVPKYRTRKPSQCCGIQILGIARRILGFLFQFFLQNFHLGFLLSPLGFLLTTLLVKIE